MTYFMIVYKLGVMIKVLLAEEQQDVRRGIRMRLDLEYDIVIVGETDDGWDALRLAREQSAQVVVTSIELSGLDGFQLTERLSREIPGCTVVILSLYDDLPTQKRASQAGASFVVSKLESDDKLIAAIRSASTKT
jgi:NarL family two-component system response regulator LiaR